jgi:competence protein ComEC
LAVVAQSATVPVAVPVFGVLSLVAPAANAVCAPLVSAVLVLGMAGLALSAVLPAVGRFVLGMAVTVAGGACSAASWFASLPSAAIPMRLSVPVATGVALACAVVVWARWPQPRAAVARLGLCASALGLVMLMVGPRAPAGVRVTVLDVGQGDAILIRDGPDVALIDTGPSERALSDALARNGVRSLEAVLLTHAHDDHTGGTAALSGAHSGRELVVPASHDGGGFSAQESILRLEARQALAGDTLNVGRVQLSVLWPVEPVEEVDENESSLVVLARYGDRSVLLTGDAEEEVLAALVARGALGDVDVFKVGHHGSEGAVSAATLAALQPETAIISVGEGNRFSHPRQETIDVLAAHGCTIRRTDHEGDIDLRLDLMGDSRSVNGSATPTCATMFTVAKHRLERAHVRQDPGPQTRLPHPEHAADARGAGPHTPSLACRRGRGPRLQLPGLRRREHRCRRGHLSCEHVTVRERAPPRDRPKHRKTQQGRA